MGISTRTVWRYFRCKESCVEPILARSAQRFVAQARRWPAELSLVDHMAADLAANPLTEQELADEISALRIITLSASEPALRSAFLMVHDEMEREFVPIVAQRRGLPEHDLSVRLDAAAVSAAFRIIDEDVGRRAILDQEKISQAQALELIDRAIRDATSGRLGGPIDS